MMTTEAIREKLLQFLEDNGLERHLFQVEMDDDRVRLYPLGRLGDDWKKVNSLLPGFWCKNPKEPWLSHWLINLRVVRAVLKKHDEEKQKRVDDFK